MSHRAEVRRGTEDEGKEFERLVATLIAIRGLRQVDRFTIASNAEVAQDFDDIVAVVSKDGESRSLLIQTKHKKNVKSIKAKEFKDGKQSKMSLNKFRKSMDLVQKGVAEGKANFVEDLGRFEDVHFVLYSNRPLDLGEMEAEVTDLERDAKMTSADRSPFWRNLISSSQKTEVFRFKPEHQKQNYKNFRIFAKQQSVTCLKGIIEAELADLIALQSDAIDYREVAEELKKFVQATFAGEYQSGNCLTETSVLWKLTDIFFSKFELKLRGSLRREETPLPDCLDGVVLQRPVTVIDGQRGDKTEFLKRYLAAKVAPLCCPGELKWDKKTDVVEASGIAEDLKMAVLKRQKVTPLTVYKVLCRKKTLPFLLLANSEEEFAVILAVLNFNSSCRVVALTGEFPTPPCDKVEDLSDLASDEQRRVLDCAVWFQNRVRVPLKSLLDDSMRSSIKASVVIKIIFGEFSVGCEESEDWQKYFVQRSLRKILLKKEVLEKEKERFDRNGEGPAAAVQENTHGVVGSSTYLQWLWTVGTTKNIQNYREEERKEYESDYAHLYWNHTNVISEIPGMGKSVLLRYIAGQYGIVGAADQAEEAKWVLWVNLLNFQKYYDQPVCDTPHTSGEAHLLHFFDNRPKVSVTECERSIFAKMVAERRVVVFLDGFDEIAIKHSEEVTNVALSLQNDGFKMWISTRPHMKKFLEERLGTMAISLEPFSPADQIAFLVHYYAFLTGCDDRPKIQEFAGRLLELARDNFADHNWDEFMGVALQTRLLADYFRKDCEVFLRERKLTLDRRFNLLGLYENLIKGKVDELCKRYGSDFEISRLSVAKDQQRYFTQDIFDLDGLSPFKPSYCAKMRRHSFRDNGETFWESPKPKLHIYQRDGIAIVDEYHKLSSIHRTFAEYLAAQWLADKVVRKWRKLEEKKRAFLRHLMAHRFKGHDFLFTIFDRILCKKLPDHMSIINGRLDVRKEQDFVDAAGRSVLHMLALYHRHHSGGGHLDVVNRFCWQMRSNKDVFGYTPMDYALVAGAPLELVDRLYCERTAIAVYIDLKDTHLYLERCFRLQLYNLFKVLLVYFLGRDYLQNPREITVSCYLKERCLQSSHFVGGCDGRLKILEYLKKFGAEADGRFALVAGRDAACDEEDVDGNTALHYAVLGGNDGAIRRLASMVNRQNRKGRTPLHWAFRHKKHEAIDVLLGSGPDWKVVDGRRRTYLHLATLLGDVALLKKIPNDVDVDCQDRDGDTPLLLALKGSREDVALELLRRGAAADVADGRGWTALHYAVDRFPELVLHSKIRNFDACDKNVANDMGDTPIFYELRKQKPDLVILGMLYETGADVNHQCINGDTPFHVALYNTSVDPGAVEFLLFVGARYDIPNKSGETVLHRAILGCHVVVAKTLLRLSPDLVNDCDLQGNTCLHLAVRTKEVKMVELILENNSALLYYQNKNGESPFDLAKSDGLFDILHVLRSYFNNNYYMPPHHSRLSNCR